MSDERCFESVFCGLVLVLHNTAITAGLFRNYCCRFSGVIRFFARALHGIYEYGSSSGGGPTNLNAKRNPNHELYHLNLNPKPTPVSSALGQTICSVGQNECVNVWSLDAGANCSAPRSHLSTPVILVLFLESAKNTPHINRLSNQNSAMVGWLFCCSAPESPKYFMRFMICLLGCHQVGGQGQKAQINT